MPVPAFGRLKRATDPLDGKVMAHLRGDRPLAECAGSSDSQRKSADFSGSDPVFFFSDISSSDGSGEAPERNNRLGGDEDERPASYSEGERRPPSYAAVAVGMIRDLVNPRAASSAEGQFRLDLQADAAAAAGRLAELTPNPASFRRAVMGVLRNIGYNAGICTSRWKSGSGGLVAGNHEYIDVLTSPAATSPQLRYIVDVDFVGEFAIARPTAEYKRLSAELPRVLVGKPEELRMLVRFLAEAARQSLRSREMHVPPWRNGRYMHAKWLGPYRRTVNPVTSSSSSSSSSATASAPPPWASFGMGRADARCRFVGFDAAAPSVTTPAGRTR